MEAMNPIRCMQKAASARSDVMMPPQSNRNEDKLLPDQPIDAESPKKIDGTFVNGLCLRRISKLITDEKWRALDLLLQSADDRTTDAEIGVAYHDDVATKLHIVHFACRFNPPRTIVGRLVSIFPVGSRSPDKTGRLPLHHACKWGASHKLIKYLIEMDPSAVSVQDIQGKSPIHHLCLHYADSFCSNNSCGSTAEECMVKAMELLIEADPSILIIEDNLEATALEYAIEAHAPYRVVRRLQKASEKYWKDRVSKEESAHLSIEKCLDNDKQQVQQEERAGEHRKVDEHRVAELLTSFNQVRARCSLSSNEEKNEATPSLTAKMPARIVLAKKGSARSKYAMTA